MDRRTMNLGCYAVCLGCLFVGTLLGTGLIWVGFDNAVLWRGLATTVAVFFANLLALALNTAFTEPPTTPSWPARRLRYDDDDRPRRRTATPYDSWN